MRTTLILLLTSFLFLGMVSCTQQSQSSQNPSDSQPASLPDFSSIKTEQVFAYSCGDSLTFSAHVTRDSSWLFLDDTTVKVSTVPSGSDARYEGNSYLYWSKGSEAILQKPKGSLLTCNTLPQEKSWAAAKIRGVDFRALGQEPGWYLEVTDGKHIKYVGNYGQDTVLTPVPKPTTTDSLRIYNAQTEAHTLKIEISQQPCTDSMNGFQFPAAVTVTVDGNTYHGCGKSLRPEQR